MFALISFTLLKSKAPWMVQWLASLTSKPSRMNSSLIGCFIHTACVPSKQKAQ